MALSLLPSSAAVASFSLVFCGYIVVSLLLRLCFYQQRRHAPEGWKIQPDRFNADDDGKKDGGGSKQLGKRGPYHWLFLGCNLVTASLFAGLAAEGAVRGWATSRLRITGGNGWGDVEEGRELLLLVAGLALQSVLEYWWHRLMHLRWCYVRMHKYHHFYKAPEPFDDMYIHPFEAFGYYCILYSPSALLPMRPITFFVYMSLLGFAGVLDHAGVRVAIPGVYDTRDHDRHHSHVTVNYGFPFPFLDMLHGTYTGECWGRRFVAGQKGGAGEGKREQEEQERRRQ